MNIKFVNPSASYSIDSVMMFQEDDVSGWWRDVLFMCYTDIDKYKFMALDKAGQQEYIADYLGQLYAKEASNIDNKIVQYQQHWDKHSATVNEAFSEIFGIDTTAIFNDIIVNVTLNPISPRFLVEHVFDVFYLNSHSGALGMSLHELVHYIWFYVWHTEFGDNYSQYETPRLRWVLSEAVVYCILADSRLDSINPYTPNERVYEYFYTMQVGNRCILDILTHMYNNRTSMVDFMHTSYNFFQQNRAEIVGQCL